MQIINSNPLLFYYLGSCLSCLPLTILKDVPHSVFPKLTLNSWSTLLSAATNFKYTFTWKKIRLASISLTSGLSSFKTSNKNANLNSSSRSLPNSNKSNPFDSTYLPYKENASSLKSSIFSIILLGSLSYKSAERKKPNGDQSDSFSCFLSQRSSKKLEELGMDLFKFTSIKKDVTIIN